MSSPNNQKTDYEKFQREEQERHKKGRLQEKDLDEFNKDMGNKGRYQDVKESKKKRGLIKVDEDDGVKVKIGSGRCVMM